MSTASSIISPLTYLAALITGRIKTHFSPNGHFSGNGLPVHFEEAEDTPLSHFFRHHNLSAQAQTLFLLALAPHLQADFYDRVIAEALPQAGDFPQLGGARGKNFRGFLPTGETALFLLAGEEAEKRLEVLHFFSEDHTFAKKRILWLEEVPEGEPRLSGRIILSQEYVDLFITGKAAAPRFSMTFPAQRIETGLEWNDLVLHPDTVQQIKELETWVKYGETLMDDWGMRRKLKPGYRALFHGPPGTGKTLTASLLGKYTGKDVYRIDLSMVVSKYIGETEKNLANLFAKAENKDWILFFDEADALFGKRTNVRDAHDKYANQEVSYLLQRVEYYDGLVILATNFKSNIDDAFSRRFQSIIYFPAPGVEERLKLWQKSFPPKVQLGSDINLPSIAQKYELTGAEIINIIQFACLRALDRNDKQLLFQDLLEGIRKEFQKDGRILR
jgi:hypothetical protein